jgi:hypothetical protein
MIWAFDSPGSVSSFLIIALLLEIIQIGEGQARARNNGDVPRGSSALSGAPNWLAAESVSAKSTHLPLAQRECKLNANAE